MVNPIWQYDTACLSPFFYIKAEVAIIWIHGSEDVDAIVAFMVLENWHSTHPFHSSPNIISRLQLYVAYSIHKM
jgi:hypothetical protein